MTKKKKQSGKKKNQALLAPIFDTKPKVDRTHIRYATQLTKLQTSEVEARQKAYLNAISLSQSEGAARTNAAVSRAVVEAWRQDEDFKAREAEAFDLGTGHLEDLLYSHALKNYQANVKLLEARRPDKYRSNGGAGGGNVNVIVSPLFPDQKEVEQIKVTIDHQPQKESTS